MLVCPQKRLDLEFTVSSVFDGIVRILTDSDRFGFDLAAMAVSRQDVGARISLTLLVDASLDDTFVMQRLARHPAVLDVKSSFALQRIKETTALPIV